VTKRQKKIVCSKQTQPKASLTKKTGRSPFAAKGIGSNNPRQSHSSPSPGIETVKVQKAKDRKKKRNKCNVQGGSFASHVQLAT